MQTLNGVLQGSPEWLTARSKHFCASEAAAMMGVSRYTTRTELLRQKATGLSEEVGAEKQRLFDRGHAAEAMARPIAEQIIGEELSPVVGVKDVEGLPLLASLDGMTFIGDVIWENKLPNVSLIEQVQRDQLESHYWAQLEHQLLVSGATRVLFTASDGTVGNTHHCWYTSQPERRQQIIDGWRQFQVDLADWKPAEPKPAPVVAAVQETLPAVSVKVNGALAIVSNLPDFGQALREYIAKIPEKPSTDQEFADTEAACKALKRAEDALEAAENNALAQLADVDTMRRLVADFKALARNTRLQREKLVAQRKDQIREEIVMEGRRALNDHLASLNTRLGKPWMPTITADFAGAVKGKRTIDSLRDAANTTLAQAKIQANEIADRIQLNLNTLRDQASEHGFLFADASTIVQKAPEDFALLVKARIAEHQQAEAARLEREQAAAQARAEQEARQTEAKRIEAERDQQAALQTSLVEPAAPVLSDKAVADAKAGAHISRVADLGRQAVQMAEQVDMVKAAHAAEPATLKLGDICARLGITMTAAFVADTLGIKPSATDKRAVLFKESDYPRICRALAQHAMASIDQLQAA